MVLTPIGVVRTATPRAAVKRRRHVSEIILREDLIPALTGLADFSHLVVLFWMQEISRDARAQMQVHPRGRRDLPLLGAYATRTPYRPNPIGLTVVELLRVERNILVVRGLDAFDGTPVLDIKPFDTWDIPRTPRVPRWWAELEKHTAPE